MNRIIKINTPYVLSLANLIRDRNTGSDELKQYLQELGEEISKEIVSRFYLKNKKIITPLNHEYKGVVQELPMAIIITTKDDMEHIGYGMSKLFKNSKMGYMNFEGRRGQDSLCTPVREIVFPDLKQERVDALIIAKSVLATGCTAISLTKSALNQYMPDRLFIITIFYSTRGLHDIKKEFPNAYIFIVGESDDLNENGLLVPGIGLLEERLKKT